ncbi:MAG: Hpt domain-containing protein [Limnothrix sp. RL_2_0]|nr:Hpt domain-containing protein [Limnothrix sp. RL_2_0]
MSNKSSLAAEVTFDALIEMLGDHPEILLDIVTSFLDDAPNLMQAISEGIETKNFELVERNAHTIKSSSRLFGAEQFAAQCQILEDSAKNEQWNEVKTIASSLQQNYLLIAQELTHKLKTI